MRVKSIYVSFCGIAYDSKSHHILLLSSWLWYCSQLWREDSYNLFLQKLFFYNSIHRDHLQSSPQEHHRGQILVRYQRLFILWFTLMNCLRTNSSILIFQIFTLNHDLETRSGAWDWLFPPHRKYLNGSVVLMKGKAKDKIIGSFLSSYGTVIASAMASWWVVLVWFLFLISKKSEILKVNF